MAITEVIGWLRQRSHDIAARRQDNTLAFSSVDAFFAEIAGGSDAPSQPATNMKVVRFSFSGDGGVSDRTITLDGVRAAASATSSAKPDLVIRTDPKTWLAVISGHEEAYPRLRAGRLRIEGDPTVLCTLMEHFDRRKVARGDREQTPMGTQTEATHAETRS